MVSGVGGGEGGGNSKDKRKWGDSSKVYTRKSFKGLKTNNLEQEDTRNLPSQEQQLGRERGLRRFEVASADSSSLIRPHRGGNKNSVRNMQTGNGVSGAGLLRVESRVSINLAYKTKKERRELRRKLEADLNLLRSFMKKLERGGGNLRSLGDEGGNIDVGKLKRVHSEVGSVGWHEGRPVDQLSVTVEHSVGASDNLEKEKRTPKANPFYQSSDFISGKEKFPPSEQNKKSKSMGKKNGESGSGLGMGNSSSKVFSNCSAVLEKVMKHKHAWVFNNPVDVKALGLHDYFTIIKHPMDLGTVKSRLNTNWYKSPKEFAEDVRLTFRNAMTYNPKGHDVYVMADILLKMFEEKWGSIEAEHTRELRASTDNVTDKHPRHYESSLLTPTSRKAPPPAPPLPPPVDGPRKVDRSESMTNPVGVKPKNPHSTPGRKPVPKKPKAKDPNKRDMTYLEKQKLGNELQNLPSEKLDNVVQIIRKRNPSLYLNDDEIEVDIDSVDTETLWELDRFVTNYKKHVSKIKRTAEHGLVGGNEPTRDKKEAPSDLERPKEKRAEEKNARISPAVQSQQEGGNASRSNSSRSTSSDSRSSAHEKKNAPLSSFVQRQKEGAHAGILNSSGSSSSGSGSSSSESDSDSSSA